LTEFFSQHIINIDADEEQRSYRRDDGETLWVHIKIKNPKPPFKSSPTNILSARDHVWDGPVSSGSPKRTGEPYSFGNSEETRDKGEGLLSDRYDLAMVQAIKRDLQCLKPQCEGYTIQKCHP
jgi:hypothetical protein